MSHQPLIMLSAQTFAEGAVEALSYFASSHCAYPLAMCTNVTKHTVEDANGNGKTSGKVH